MSRKYLSVKTGGLRMGWVERRTSSKSAHIENLSSHDSYSETKGGWRRESAEKVVISRKGEGGLRVLIRVRRGRNCSPRRGGDKGKSKVIREKKGGDPL